MQEQEVINEYEKHLQKTIGATQETRRNYIRYVHQFLREGLGFSDVSQGNLSNLKPGDLILYVMKQREHYKIAFLKAMITALRSFIRFLQMKGFCEAGLVNAVPTIPQWKLSQIPKYLTKEQLKKILASFDHTTPTGRRDYAIVLCLVRLGLRRSEAAHLTLNDIDWRSGVLHIPVSKSRRVSSVPLPGDVGKAIVAYLRNGRPKTQTRCIFVSHRGSVGDSLTGGGIGAVVYRAFKRAGINVPSGGSHILRHTIATHMVQQGISIKEVADFLRHRSLDTTAIYTKVNLPMLFEVALPWPKEGEIT